MNYTTQQNGDQVTMTLTGDLKMADQSDFKSLLEECSDGGPQKFRLNLSGISHIDSSGLGMLLMLNDTVKNNGGSVVLVNPAEGPSHAFQLARFDELFTIEA